MTTSTAVQLELTKRHPLIGAEIRGLDLAASLDVRTLKSLHDAWMEHLMLIFPAQDVSDEAQIAFGRQFGELEIHPSLAHRASRHREIYRVSNVEEQVQTMPVCQKLWIRQRLREILSKHAQRRRGPFRALSCRSARLN
ncbi:MAG: TauD/TfdA family dioxygenase [Hyphomicrobiaceae bacterium]